MLCSQLVSVSVTENKKVEVIGAQVLYLEDELKRQ